MMKNLLMAATLVAYMSRAVAQGAFFFVLNPASTCPMIDLVRLRRRFDRVEECSEVQDDDL